MNKTLLSLLFLTALLFSFPVNAQRQYKEPPDDDIGDKITSEVDKFVDRMTHRWKKEQDDFGFDEDTLQKKSRRYTEDIEDIEKNAETFSGDKEIEESEVIAGNVVVKGGNLTVYGIVDGDVLVVGGDLHVKHKGKITGNARVINGSIYKDEGAVIEGFEDKSSTSKASYRKTGPTFSRSTRTFDVPWLDEQTNIDDAIFRYNRVEGLFLGLGVPKKYNWEGARPWNAYGSVGWGFKSHIWRGNLGLTRQFAILSPNGNAIIELGSEGYSLTDTKDQWVVSLHENTVAALFTHQDFRDYYERRGATVHIAYYTKQDYLKSELKIAFAGDSYDSLSNTADWAFFGGDKSFFLNPPIDVGRMRSAIISGGVTTLTKTSDGPEGWSLFGSVEVAQKSWGGEFEFDQYIADIRRYQPLGQYDNLNIRLRIGTTSGLLPVQRAFELGGLGTLGGYDFKSFIGNRMLLVNTEFIINGSFLDELDFWPTWIFRHFNFLISSDAGFTRIVSSNVSAFEGFEHMKWNDFHHSFGIALANRSGSFRIGIAWRTDEPAPAQFVLRFSRPF